MSESLGPADCPAPSRSRFRSDRKKKKRRWVDSIDFHPSENFSIDFHSSENFSKSRGNFSAGNLLGCTYTLVCTPSKPTMNTRFYIKVKAGLISAWCTAPPPFAGLVIVLWRLQTYSERTKGCPQPDGGQVVDRRLVVRKLDLPGGSRCREVAKTAER